MKDLTFLSFQVRDPQHPSTYRLPPLHRPPLSIISNGHGLEHDVFQEQPSLIVISQDLDELIEITHHISVISNGILSKPLETKNLDIKKLGMMMGGSID